MISKDMQDKNRAFMGRVSRTILNRYSGWRENIPYEQLPGAIESSQSIAYWGLINAINLLMAEQDQTAYYLLRLADTAARDTLQRQAFDRGNENTVRYDEPTAIARGKAICLQTIHHVAWICSGSRPLDIWQQSADCYAEYYKLWFYRYQNKRRPDTYDVIWRYILAEEYDKAILFYYEHYPKPLEAPPTDKRVFRSQSHVLYALAEYARGNAALYSLVQAGVSSWYEKCQNRVDYDIHLPELVCLGWAYFWHHYFVGADDIIKIIHDMRGY